MNTTKYEVILRSEEVRKRVRCVTHKGKVVSFVVQLEYNNGQGWRQVVRFDNAHGFVHRDRYFANGPAEKHYFIAEQDLGKALDRANAEINEQWETWLAEYREGER